MRFPCTAVASIFHRMSGVILFLCIPVFLWGLEKSLHSEAGFAAVGQCFTSLGGKLFLWALMGSLLYHLVAGIRHLLMDIGIGESQCGGKIGANVVFVVSAIVIMLLGVWLW